MNPDRESTDPRPGSIVDVNGAPCTRALPESYPLYAVCRYCGQPIIAHSGPDPWVHTADYRPSCQDI